MVLIHLKYARFRLRSHFKSSQSVPFLQVSDSADSDSLLLQVEQILDDEHMDVMSQLVPSK